MWRKIRNLTLLQIRKKLRRNLVRLISIPLQTYNTKSQLLSRRKRKGRGGTRKGKKSPTSRRRGARSRSRDVRSTWFPTTSEASTVRASRGLWKSWSARKLHSSSAWMRPSYKPHCASRTTSPTRPARKEVGDAGKLVILEHRSS